MAWVLFGETLTLVQIVGMLVGALGGVIVTRGKAL
jgi:drug/metabolite transporter (DMT)-like permease